MPLSGAATYGSDSSSSSFSSSSSAFFEDEHEDAFHRSDCRSQEVGPWRAH